MAIGIGERAPLGLLQSTEDPPVRQSKQQLPNVPTSHGRSDPSPACSPAIVVDIPPQTVPDEDHVPLESRSTRIDSWNLPNCEKGMRVTFQDITYRVKARGKAKGMATILQDVSGYFGPRQMTAIMGPSGSGKSTLLDLLAGRKTIGEMSGEILFAGASPTKPFLRRFTGYVEQNDTLLAELSAREMLLYTARLALPRKTGRASIVEKVDQLVQDLGLKACQHTPIGDPMSRGISGGQCKRVNIGVALVTEPRVLFLDEPTSGLDSYTAHQVMEVVKSLLFKSRPPQRFAPFPQQSDVLRLVIFPWIHSNQMGLRWFYVSLSALPSALPSTALRHRLSAFSSQSSFCKKGRVAYFGASGSAAINYFHSFPQVPRKEADESVAEWIIHATTDADLNGDTIFVDHYRDSPLKKQNDVNLESFVQIEAGTLSLETRKALATRKGNANPLWWNVWVMLSTRTPRNYTNVYYLFGRWFDKTVFTVLLFTFYWRVATDDAAINIPNIVGALFMWVTLAALGAGPYLPGIVLERSVYLREVQDGLYGAGSYLMFKMIEEYSMAVVMSVVFALPAFYICGFSGSFFVFWLAWLISLFNGIAFAYAAAALSPTMEIATAMLLTVPTALLFATGYVLRYTDIPKPWLWLVWINWMWYGFGALMINQFAGTETVLLGEETPLQYYSLDGARTNEWLFLFGSAVSAFVLLAIVYAALKFVRHQKR